MTACDDRWVVEFIILYHATGKAMFGCECFCTRAEAEARAEQMRSCSQKLEVTVSHYKKVAVQA